EVALACEGTIAVAELDTSWFLHNAPAAAQLSGRTADGEWRELLPRTAIAPDNRNRFLLTDASPCTAVRLDVFPDGGMARLRLHGTPTEGGHAALSARWNSARWKDT
ncbi:Allantoicase repeat-containing protein, partial [Pseudonocardia thermophila]